MSFLEDSRVRIFQSQEKAQELPESAADYGLSLPGLLARFDRDSCTLKIAQCSLFAEEIELSLTLPRSGMLQNGCVYPLLIAERHTNETDSGLWATPTTMDRLPPKSAEALHKEATQARPGRSKPANLRDQVSNMRNWPTPAARDYKGARKPEAMAKTGRNPETNSLPDAVEFQDGETGRLNPMWVEWLMGWPLGWTDLQPLEMDRFLERQQQHSGC